MTMYISNRKLTFYLLAAMIAGAFIAVGILYVGGKLELQSAMGKVPEVYRTLQDKYVDPIDRRKLEDGAITGMLRALEDPYTTYMTPEEAKSFMENVSNEFEGIGAEMREENGKIMIVAPIHDSPAEKAGLKPNDVVIAVDGKDLTGETTTEAVKRIRGPKGTEVTLTIQRAGVSDPFDVTIVRDTIPLKSVEAELLDGGMAKIHVTKFSETTSGEFQAALDEMRAQGAQGFIIDLRQNPGGLLSAAVQLSEHFVPRGKEILKVKYRSGRQEVYKAVKDTLDLPVVVLIDEGSASASEIMAGAMKESGGIPLVGMKTFGKGTVQTTDAFADGSMLKYTTGQWLTPNDHLIHKQGISPDVEVSLPEYAKFPLLVLSEPIQVGDAYAAVETAEKYLQALGYKPGKIDAIYDEQTATAVSSFQRDKSLSVTGTLDSETAQAMIDALRGLIADNDTQLAKAQEVLGELMSK